MFQRVCPITNPLRMPHRRTSRQAFTLVELIAASVVLASISLVSTALLISVLQTGRAVSQQDELDRLATIALLRMETHVRESVAIYIPNTHKLTRGILAVSYRFDDDNDGLFDEDGAGAADALHGVTGFDDDGDGLIDEGDPRDDDEDGLIDEDPINGIDNDGDGMIDEDYAADMNGVGGADDDGDLLIDEDGTAAIVYYVDGTDLMEWHPDLGSNVVAGNVSSFSVTYEPAASALGTPAVVIQLNLLAVTGDVRNYRTRVTPRNYGLFGS